MPEADTGQSWQLGDHLSVTYAADDECRELLTAFARRGVTAGHRVVIFLDAGATDLARHLRATVSGAAPGQFTALLHGTGMTGSTPVGSTFGGAPSGVAEMIGGLEALHDATFAAGWPALSVAGDMAAGAGTIVRFAASRPNRHTVVRCTRGVRQALQIVGAEAVPSLVLRDQISGA